MIIEMLCVFYRQGIAGWENGHTAMDKLPLPITTNFIPIDSYILVYRKCVNNFPELITTYIYKVIFK